MKSDVARFAGEINPPQSFINPLHGGLNTLRGQHAVDAKIISALQDVLVSQSESGVLLFKDLEPERTPDKDWIIDRFVDVTGGVDPGHPTIQLTHNETKTEDVVDASPDKVKNRLDSFYQLTGLEPRPLKPKQSNREMKWGGLINKLLAHIEMPQDRSSMRSLLHELGHGGMHLMGFVKDTETDVIGTKYAMTHNVDIVTSGLLYDLPREGIVGEIVEEAVAEGLGALANRRLGLVQTRYNDGRASLPEMVAPYIAGNDTSGSAPSAVAFELIAKELGIPSDDYFRRFVDYANAGVTNLAAREEVAEIIYKGTRGRLTLGQIEILPYPITRAARLALLWAVEDALEIPANEQYSKIFA